VGLLSRSAAFLIALLVFGWAFLRNVQPALADTGFGGAWTNLGKALALCGGALAVAGLPRRRESRDQSLDLLLFAGGICLAVFLVNSGIQHFLFANFVKGLVPVWIPGALSWTYFAGIALIAGGVGLIVPKTTRAAGMAVGLMISAWVVVLHIPRALAAAPAAHRNEWTAVFEAVAFTGIAFILTRKATNERR
jgi:uncharacterized membrane protein